MKIFNTARKPDLGGHCDRGNLFIRFFGLCPECESCDPPLWKRLVNHGLAGVIIGILVLHPLSMIAHNFFHLDMAQIAGALGASFSYEHMAMIVYFSLIGMVFGLVHGIYAHVNSTLYEEIRNMARRQSAILEQLPAGVGVLNRDGEFTLTNPHMQGYIQRSVMSSRISKWRVFDVDGHPLPPNQWPDSRALRGETVNPGIETRYTAENGRNFYFNISAAPLLSEEGDITGAVAVVQDITERKQIEEQLRQAQKMESVGRLAGGIAHEFNNMLNVIIGYAEILDSRLDKENTLRQYVEEIQKAAHRSAKMTSQLLAYSRKQMVQPKLINLNQTIESQMNLLKHIIGENIGIRFHPGDDLWPVRIDPHQVDQILSNLVINARDAINSHGQVIIATRNMHISEANATPDLPPGDYVHVEFADTGSGMDEDTMKNIFEPYFTTKEVGEGTGLGLATVYGIVKQNEGHIYVESRKGEGTTFTLYFPSRIAVDEEVGSAETVPPPGEETIRNYKQKTRRSILSFYNGLPHGFAKKAMKT